MMRIWPLLVLCACGGIQASLPEELWQRLSKEDRLAIYERENAVVIAQSRLDEARLLIRQTKERINQLGDRYSRCKARLEKTNQSARIDGVKKMRDAQEAFLDDQLSIAEAHVELRKKEIDAARAVVELQKARQLVKSGLASEKTIEDFERAARDAAEVAKKAERQELDLRAESQKKFLDWKAAEAEYART